MHADGKRRDVEGGRRSQVGSLHRRADRLFGPDTEAIGGFLGCFSSGGQE